MKSFFALFLLSIIIIFGLHFFLYEKLGSYFDAFIVTLPAILLTAYIFIVSIFKQKDDQTKALEHTINETMHEINLPISTIEANIKMLQKSLKDEKSQRRAKRVLDATKRLKRLYDILNYNFKKDIYEVEKSVVDISQVIKDRVSYFKELNRNLFELNLETMIVEIDKIGFEQALDNLIENAMKYSNKDDLIIIKIENFKLIIEDRGFGIDSNEIVKIYNRYYQADSSNSGSGIGLWIVKSFCDSQNIALKIISERENGTKVVMDFTKLQKKLGKELNF